MRVLSRGGIVLLLICVAMMTSCREGGKGSGNSSTVAIPAHFELNFDDVFDLTKPCTLTPALLEAKLDSLAVVPREKLYRVVQISNQPAHWISVQSSPVHNPVYSIFEGSFHPTSTTVIWQGQSLEHFFCTMSAEKDQEVPLKLVDDIGTSLGAGHTFNALLKQYEWTLEHYSVSAKYSTNVGKRVPVFLVTVRNKQVQQPVVQVPVPQPPAGASSVHPVGSTSDSPHTIDLDHLIDWRDPAGVSMQQFDTKIDLLEKTAGQKLLRRTLGRVEGRFFDRQLNGQYVKFTLFGGQYKTGGYIAWKPDGSLSQIELANLKTADGLSVEPLETIAKLDQRFGRVHATEGRVSVWNTPSFRAIFLKYSDNSGYALRFTLPDGGVLAEPLVQGGMGAPAPPSAPGPSRAQDFKLRLAQVNGLLISPLASGEEAGMITKMTLSAAFNLGKEESVLRFNQDVGGDMRQSLNEVYKLALFRHADLPLGHTVEIGFEDKYVDKDGPSAAVACALLVESAVTGQTWDPLFAVTGDLNADGSVQPIGGVRAKIRGATKGSCKLVAVPAKNEKAVADTLLLDGPGPLVGIAVFGIKTFDDAMRLARPDRPETLARALADFDAMRTVIQRDPRQAAALLRTPHAIQRLQALYAVAPECYSAKYLLGYAQGRVARTLSLGGSIEAAHDSAQAILYAIKNDVATAVNKLKPDEVGNALSKLRSLRPSMDQRVWPFVDGVTDLGEVLRGAILNPVRSGARYQDILRKVEKSASAAESAMSFLMNTTEVREELGL